MTRAAAGLSAGIRLSDHISLGVIAKTFPLDRVRQILSESLFHWAIFCSKRVKTRRTRLRLAISITFSAASPLCSRFLVRRR